MGLPVWLKEAWRKMTEETIPEMQAEIAALRERVEELERASRRGGYEGGY